MSSVAGSVGGASDDAGTEYKRAVVAFAVAHGLADSPLPLPCLMDDQRHVVSVSTETTDPVDDVRIEFASGRTAYLQAKRSLRAGPQFTKAVAQWVEAALNGIDRERDRLVIVSGHVSGPLKLLGELLERRRSDHPAAPTLQEQKAADALDALLIGLSDDQRQAVWACGAIWELNVEELYSPDARVAISELRHLVADRSAVHAAQAWTTLLSAAGRTARRRTGHRLSGWMQSLTAASIPLQPAKHSIVSALLRRQEAIDAYFARLVRDGSQIDLRALGADLPPLHLEESDATVDVGIDPDDPRIKGSLLWAFLRRHRIVLTGLPGGGKSTAIRQLAAQLTRDNTLPFPVVVSLRGLNPRHPSKGVREQIIGSATRDLTPTHRSEVSSEINRRLDKGEPVALLLDALDETYDDRHEIVIALQSMADDLPEGVAFLLATRRVGYAQAATLGWQELELLPPANARRTVHGVLELAAEQRGIDPLARPAWVKEREAWVGRALADDVELEETPLLPTFLAILASTHTLDRLPHGRGDILVAVVEDFVLRRELISRRDTVVEPEEALHLGRRAFAREAALILETQGHATRSEAISAIADDLVTEWGLSRGPAQASAKKAARALDEAGVFVFDTGTDRVIPRIALLSEIGAAMFAVDDLASLDGWVRRRIDAAQFEALVLACALTPRALEACESYLAQDPSNASLATAMVRATSHGDNLSEPQLRLVCGALIEDICSATDPGWQRLDLLLRLHAPDDLIEHLLASMTQLPAEYQAIIRSELQYGADYDGPSLRGHNDFRAIFEMDHLPPLPGKRVDARPWFSLLQSDLRVPQLHAAEGLIKADSRAARDLVERAMSGSSSRATQNGLRDILERHGHHTEVTQIDAYVAEKFRGWDMSGMLSDVDDSHPLSFYAVFDAWVGAPLTSKQQNTLGDLASLLQFAQMDAYSMGSLLPSERDYVLSVIRYTALALGLDVDVLASEASVVLQRIQTFGGMDPSRALAQELEDEPEPDWERIDDPFHAVSIFVRTLSRGLTQATFAARMLSVAPLPIVEDPLREAITYLAESPRHQRLAAMALAVVTSGRITNEWLAHENPVLREVAASVPTLSASARRDLLRDADRKVRVSALRYVIDEDSEDLMPLLEQVLADDPVGWMCRRCGTINNASKTTCIGSNCLDEAPQLYELAEVTLRKVDPARKRSQPRHNKPSRPG